MEPCHVCGNVPKDPVVSVQRDDKRLVLGHYYQPSFVMSPDYSARVSCDREIYDGGYYVGRHVVDGPEALGRTAEEAFAFAVEGWNEMQRSVVKAREEYEASEEYKLRARVRELERELDHQKRAFHEYAARRVLIGRSD